MDILDQILITPQALQRYCEWAAKAAYLLAPPLISSPDEIGDEQAEALPDGRLRIFVRAGGQTLEFFLQPGEWAWHAG